MTRVHGHAGKPTSNAPLGFGACQWCGEEFAKRGTSQIFCSLEHRTEFNNLQKRRGPVLVPLIMAMRYERTLAGKLKLWSKVCTLLFHFREEDRRERGGRKSWLHPNTIIQSRPDLFNMPRGPKRKKS